MLMLYSNGDTWEGEIQLFKPSTNDPLYQIWDAQNSMVMAWLIHSMQDKINETYLYYPIAKEIWDAMTCAYSNLENYSQVFELRNKA